MKKKDCGLRGFLVHKGERVRILTKDKTRITGSVAEVLKSGIVLTHCVVSVARMEYFTSGTWPEIKYPEIAKAELADA